jgi:hypothetical protein
MSTLQPLKPYGGGRVWRRVRTTLVLLVGIAALVAAGWEGRALVTGSNKPSTPGPSTSVSGTPSPSCTPSPTPSPTPTPTPTVTSSKSSKKHSSAGHATHSPSASASSTALPKPKTITLNVYNSTSRNGLARKTANLLAARGFTIGNVSNDPSPKAVKGFAEVRYGPKGALAARVVAAEVKGAVLVEDKRTSADVDLAVGAAYKHLASPAEVRAALSPSASPTPSASC